MTTPWITEVDIRARLASMDPRGTHLLDSIQKDLADDACEWIETETEAHIVLNTYSKVFDGHGKPRLHLPFRFVRSVTSLTLNGTPVPIVPAASFFGAQQGAFFDDHSIVYPPRFSLGYANVAATWTAGFDANAVPSPYKTLACAVAIIMLKERDRWGDQTKNLPGQTVTYVRDLPPKERRTFDSLLDRRGYFPFFGGY